MSDLFALEDGADLSVSIDDVRGVSNYVAAMDLGLQKIKDDFPLSLGL